MKRPIEFVANGAVVNVDVDPTQPLLEVVREQLGFLGARRGCETAYCGACTVLVDGLAVRSCIFLAARAAGRRVTTIEGLASGDTLDRLQAAFIEHGALECGYCIPGMILLAKSALESMPNPTDADIRRALSSNLCRCTGYVKMIEAVKSVAASAETGAPRG
jgi:carbon-monoxide dehydrogenase small subunit